MTLNRKVPNRNNKMANDIENGRNVKTRQGENFVFALLYQDTPYIDENPGQSS